jgi:hypothetical protein
MGREIRRVPRDWCHPRYTKHNGVSHKWMFGDRTGQFMPMHDQEYEKAADAWLAECLLWQEGRHPDQIRYADDPREGRIPKYYWDWVGRPPDKDYYRPKFESEPICYQIYETVSEGTPVSPVFESLQAMEDWLVEHEAVSREAAHSFVASGWVPSMVITGGRIKTNYETATGFGPKQGSKA